MTEVSNLGMLMVLCFQYVLICLQKLTNILRCIILFFHAYKYIFNAKQHEQCDPNLHIKMAGTFPYIDFKMDFILDALFCTLWIYFTFLLFSYFGYYA